METKKMALITGATSGIGLELARLMAKNGWSLVLIARNRQRLDDISEELKRDFNTGVVPITADLSLPSAPADVFRELQAKSIQPDILVNNAGFNEYGPFSATNLENELRMIQLHVSSLTALTKLLLPPMLEKKNGKILNVASIGSFTPVPFNAVYGATKAYILSFSESLAEELRGTGVTVTALCPGATATEFAQRAGMENVLLFRGVVMDAAKVARIGFDAMMLGKTIVVPGCLNWLTVFSLRFTPRKLMGRVSKYLMARVES